MNDRLKADSLPWLLEPDEANPGVRCFALRDLLDRPAVAEAPTGLRLPSDPQVVAAHTAVMRTVPVPAILDVQHPDGYWVKPGPGYSPKYRATLWQVLFLAQLGADGQDERVRRAVEYVFGKTGTGKTFLTRTLLAGLIQENVAVNLVFDMHNEYGWKSQDEAKQEVVEI